MVWQRGCAQSEFIRVGARALRRCPHGEVCRCRRHLSTGDHGRTSWLRAWPQWRAVVMHRIVRTYRRITPEQLPTVRNLDGIARAATAAELLNLGMVCVGG